MLAMIRERQTIRVEELAAHFQVSLMTIRRDLQALEDSKPFSAAIENEGSGSTYA